MSGFLINADDFGLNSSVNNAITELFVKDIINSTTIMANMPGVDEAIELSFKYKIINKIGIHLVLTEGIPLTEEIKSVNFLFNGKARFTKYWYLLYLKKYQILIFNEFSAQIEKIQSNGIPITHLDTHHHVHEVYFLTKLLIILQNKYNIPYIRILNNLEKSTKLHKRIYRKLINCYIKYNHSNYSDLFGNQTDLLLKSKEDPDLMRDKGIEIMVHPDYNSKGKLIDKVGNNEYDYVFLQTMKTELGNK